MTTRKWTIVDDAAEELHAALSEAKDAACYQGDGTLASVAREECYEGDIENLRDVVDFLFKTASELAEGQDEAGAAACFWSYAVRVAIVQG